MMFKKLLYISLILILPAFSCKCTTEPEVITRNYFVIKIHGMTVEEFSNKYYEAPVVKEIKLIDYKIGTDLRGQVLLKDIGWLDIKSLSTISDQFTVNTEGLLGKVEWIWFRIHTITKNLIEGDFEVCGSDIDGFPVSFSGILIRN
ncbi:hypothetical protein ACFL4T_05000 [candidate division KSB1 bacterium]